MSTTADATDVGEQIQATIVTCDDEPNQCTLHPLDPDDHRRTTEWITADEGSYVTVELWR
ncbi:hypothetical protein U4E84_15670 [Halorubrum sp. AD140]|uniref:DUF7511 domain-containing protein n=1 Tax=Halorubrum sp. AD140 TaxID=3050073 RepID=UPI002ACD0F0C|nr:hypothetical protein [Halorubrum sp. AD140]MDZ5812784.1 hypothetical protein [Halorubrum sp. AD140]